MLTENKTGCSCSRILAKVYYFKENRGAGMYKQPAVNPELGILCDAFYIGGTKD